MADRLWGALSLARRAGALETGFDAVCGAAQKGQAALVLLCADTSPGTQKRVRRVCAAGCPVRTLSLRQDEMAMLCKKPVGVLAVTNTDLAALCLQHLPVGGHKEEDV